MNSKTRFVLVTTMTAVMVCMVTLIATLLNIGLRHDFMLQWLKSYVVGWPVAAITGFFFMPAARRITDRILTFIGGAA
jgi:hypothetical protein